MDLSSGRKLFCLDGIPAFCLQHELYKVVAVLEEKAQEKVE